MKMKVSDFTIEHVQLICDIINRGNQCEVKKERENIVIVEIKRNALKKSPIQED